MKLTVKTLAIATLAAALTAASACSPPTPARPTYAKDVAPIFEAHCNRCHGAVLQGDPHPTTVSPVPQLCHFSFLGTDPANCASDGGAPPPSCVGADQAACLALAVTYINGQGKPMPPAPSTKLSDWEIDVITAWSKEMPPAP